MMAMIGVFLMLRTGIVVHQQKIDETQRRVFNPVVLVMMNQLCPAGRLVNAEAGKQTASEHKLNQKKSDNGFHRFGTYLTRCLPIAGTANKCCKYTW